METVPPSTHSTERFLLVRRITGASTSLTQSRKRPTLPLEGPTDHERDVTQARDNLVRTDPLPSGLGYRITDVVIVLMLLFHRRNDTIALWRTVLQESLQMAGDLFRWQSCHRHTKLARLNLMLSQKYTHLSSLHLDIPG